LEDREIVALYLDRDERAIRHSAEKYGPRLRGLSFGILRDAQAAEECESDAYWEAWNSIPPHRPENYLYAFLARIVRHLSLDLCRKRDRLKRRGTVCELSAELEQCIPAPDPCACRLEDMALGEAVNGFLATLSVEKRRVFLRRYWYLDSISDISKRFSLSESKVKTMLFRCRGQMRDYLEREGYTL